MKPQYRQALILASIALVFFVGIMANVWLKNHGA